MLETAETKNKSESDGLEIMHNCAPYANCAEFLCNFSMRKARNLFGSIGQVRLNLNSGREFRLLSELKSQSSEKEVFFARRF